MTSGMPELGSKISLVSKADIRYEGRLFTVDPQECTIALASVRSFGTEDRETQYPVAPQSQVYDYILFRGSDIKDIRVLNNVPSMPNDPAIMQMSVPPTLGSGGPSGQFPGQFSHPVVGQPQYPHYHPMAGFPGGSMLDLIGGGSQQNNSRSGTPALSTHRKSPTSEQGTQAGIGARGDTRRGSNTNKPQQHNQHQQQHQHQQHQQQQNQQLNNQRVRTNSHNRQRYPNQGVVGQGPPQPPHHSTPAQYNNYQQQGYNRGGWRGRSRGRGRGFVPRNGKNTLKFDNDYDFEQANTEFEELRSQLAKAKISDGETKTEGEAEKKEDSGNETGAGEAEAEDDGFAGYDKAKSFFDNISCEAVERSKGRSQRTDWRTERKLNSETFGVASARRGTWRGRPQWRHHPQQHSYGWRQSAPGVRGARGARGVRPAPQPAN